VRDGEHDAAFRPQFEQDAQESNRIRSPGDGDGYAVADADEFLLANIGKDFLAHALLSLFVRLVPPAKAGSGKKKRPGRWPEGQLYLIVGVTILKADTNRSWSNDPEGRHTRPRSYPSTEQR